MADNVPVSREDGPGKHAAAGGVDGVSGSTAHEIDTTLEAAFPRTHHILTLEFGDRKDFDDPRKEWRRLFSELLGTFALVLVAAGGGILHAKGQRPPRPNCPRTSTGARSSPRASPTPVRSRAGNDRRRVVAGRRGPGSPRARRAPAARAAGAVAGGRQLGLPWHGHLPDPERATHGCATHRRGGRRGPRPGRPRRA
jgi:hypothetical protein